jgi:hypothetical protein
VIDWDIEEGMSRTARRQFRTKHSWPGRARFLLAIRIFS